MRGQGTCVADLSRIFGYLSPHYTQQLLMSADVTIIRPSSDTASSGHDSYNVPPTHDGEVDGVGEGGAGVDLEQYSTVQYSTVQYSTVQYSTDLALVLPRVAPPHVRDDQLPLPRS